MRRAHNHVPMTGAHKHVPMTGMQDLPQDVLVTITEQAGPKSAQALHLVNKAFRDATRASQVALIPRQALSPQQLFRACSAFPRATSLTLTACALLTPDSLQAILPGLPGLLSLRVEDYARLRALPDAVGDLSALRELSIGSCAALRRLPEGISSLADLRRLSFGSCAALRNLPAGIGALSRLENLDLHDCRALISLPETISGLVSLQGLDMTDCQSLKEIPKGVTTLELLQRLCLRGCDALQEFPEIGADGFYSLARLDLSGCIRLEVYQPLLKLVYIAINDTSCYLAFCKLGKGSMSGPLGHSGGLRRRGGLSLMCFLWLQFNRKDVL